MKLNDDYFKKVASHYAEIDGQRLKKEIPAVNQQVEDTSKIDFRIRRDTRQIRMNRFVKLSGSLAACLLMFLISMNIFQTENAVPRSDNTTNETEERLLIGQQSVVQDEMEMAESFATGMADDSVQAEFINLSVVLPEQYQIAEIKQDQQETIYYIENSDHDDIILTLSYADMLPQTSVLKDTSMEGYRAKGLSSDAYQILSFQKDGVLYTLTCRHEFNTLVEFGKNLL